ncbi:unnamed protein product [Candida verbasci]|uniref:Pre-mRNA-splicing factor CWC26 n=1 Tax=Candida verbasci TaxID=1227364 RepID=A0A9W4TT33_9ASCO|nr:unnamed protein product [Candida verbasci]
MSRLDYLSKYTQPPKKKKKKITSSNKQSNTSNVVIETPKLELPQSLLTEEEEEEKELEIDTPVVKIKENKGFKRIDDGTIIKQNENKQQDNNTIFRDKFGKVIDIQEYKKEQEEKNKVKEEENKVVEIRSTNDQIQFQESQKFKNNLDKNYEDPLNTFKNENKQQSNTNKDWLIYNEGIIPINRFNIPSGILWDGIIRSNGFEQLYIRQLNESISIKQSMKQDDYEYDDY